MADNSKLNDLLESIFRERPLPSVALEELVDVVKAIKGPESPGIAEAVSEFMIGIRGAVGPIGPQGPMGMQGECGPCGEEGPQGPPGKDGKDGKDGKQGPVGPKGDAGADGTVWYTGKTDPDDANGKPGDFYLNNVTGDYFRKSRGKWGRGTWVEVGNLRGPAGEKGERGPKGKTGSPGLGGIGGGGGGGAALTDTDDLTEGATNLYYTAARVYAKAKLIMQAGANITITPNDGAQTLTIASTGGAATETIPPQMFWAGVY